MTRDKIESTALLSELRQFAWAHGESKTVEKIDALLGGNPMELLRKEFKTVPADLHPLLTDHDMSGVIELLKIPPNASKFNDPLDWYQHWWQQLLAAAERASKNSQVSDVKTGRLIEMGQLVTIDTDGTKSEYPMALLIEFSSVPDIKQAIDDGQCKFTWGDQESPGI